MIDRTPRRKRVLIIGAGRRIQNNFLPAFTCLGDVFDICGIHSRTPDRLLPVARSWGIVPVEKLGTFDLSTIDMVAISVQTAQNARVLEQLKDRAADLEIVIDTPIAWNQTEREESFPLLTMFKKVTVTEDYMNFPQFELVRKAVADGWIGRPRNVTLSNIGFLYHGLALIRSFNAFGPVGSHVRIVLSSDGKLLRYQFADNFIGNVVGPYRRHTTGGFHLEGDNGVISEFPFDRDAAGAKPVFLLSPIRTEGKLTGYRLTGKHHEETTQMPEIGQMQAMNFSDKTEINLVRGCGLIQVLRSAAGAHDINSAYGFKNALYDSFVSTRADQGVTPLDPFDTFPTTVPALATDSSNSGPVRWKSRVPTALKRTPAMASDLLPGDKIAIALGTTLTAKRGELDNGHVRLSEVCLNGCPLDSAPWYVFPNHWGKEVGDGTTQVIP